MSSTVSIAEMLEARRQTSPFLHVTPLMSSSKIDKLIGGGTQVVFKCEHLQKTGSFKARGAIYSAILAKRNGANGLIGHSTGNHGQALAWAAQKVGLPCTIIIPKNAPTAKIDAIREYAADVVLCDPVVSVRVRLCDELAEKMDYTIVDPYNCESVINGHAAMAMEILEQLEDQEIDSIFLSVGGGGLAASIAFCMAHFRPDIEVFLVEPEEKQLAQLLEHNIPCSTDTLSTCADGARVGNIGSICELILREHCIGKVVSVKEEDIKKALKLIWTRLKQRVEPTAAMAFAGVMFNKPNGVKNPVVILCGGNVDVDYVI